MHIDSILIEESASDDEWLVETEEPCLTDDIEMLDEAREDNEDRDFLEIIAHRNEITSIAVDNQSREKRQRDNSSSVDKEKGPTVDDVDETEDDIDPEDTAHFGGG